MKEQVQSTAVTGSSRDYTDFPSIPADMVAKFPSLAENKTAQDDWWQKLKANLRGIEDDLDTLRRKANSP